MLIPLVSQFQPHPTRQPIVRHAIKRSNAQPALSAYAADSSQCGLFPLTVVDAILSTLRYDVRQVLSFRQKCAVMISCRSCWRWAYSYRVLTEG